jgi:hypothetical protein
MLAPRKFPLKIKERQVFAGSRSALTFSLTKEFA